MTTGTTPLTNEDKELVERARHDDQAAYDRLVNAHYGTVYAISWTHLKQREAAEDLAQEVFVRAWLKIDTLKDGALFGRWVARMTRNLSLNWKRDNVRRSRLAQMVSATTDEGEIEFGEAGDLLAAPQPSPRDQLATNQEETAMKDALNTLSDEDRELVTLHYMGELSHRQIAERLGIHHTTVSRRLGRALADLRGTLEETLAPPPPSSTATASACSAVAVVAAMSGSQKAALAATAEATAAGANLAAPGSTLLGSLMLSPVVQSITLLTGLQKAAIAIFALLLSGTPFLYSAARQNGFFTPDPLEGANPTRVVQVDFYGDYYVDIAPGEIVEMRFNIPNVFNVSHYVMSELKPGTMSGRVYLTDGTNESYTWNPDTPFETQPNFTNIQIWEEQNRMLVRTLDLDRIEGGMRLHYFCVDRPDLLPALKGLERQYKLRQISKTILHERQLEIFNEEGLFPNHRDSRRRVKDLLLNFEYDNRL